MQDRSESGQEEQKDGQETTRRCLERADVRVLTVTRFADEWRTAFIPGLDKQATKQTRRASI
jgi:hypothetical protein